MTLPVPLSDFSTYLNDPSAATSTRGQMILDLTHSLCQSVVNPLPAGSEVVVLDVAGRAYANPLEVGGQPAFYAEGEGPFSTNTPGISGGGLYLTQENKATLRRLNGSGGAFMIDTTPAGAGQNIPWWDNGSVLSGDWDTPP